MSEGQEPLRPGSYPDPWGAAGTRYWDGERWHDLVPTPGAYPPPPRSGGSGQSFRSGRRVGWIVVGVLAALLALMGFMMVKALGDTTANYEKKVEQTNANLCRVQHKIMETALEYWATEHEDPPRLGDLLNDGIISEVPDYYDLDEGEIVLTQDGISIGCTL